MKLLVTAFGPFGGRTQNASSLALAELKRRIPRLNTRVFPVDSVVAPLRLDQALRQVKPDAVILLGEAGGSKTIRLETTAWNELDFRIPDIAGRQPQGLPVWSGAPDSLRYTLPFDQIHERLLQAGHAVSFSNDPGRYLCNQILYHTLHRTGRSRTPVPAGFIHLPYEADYPTSRAVDALEIVIEEMRSWMGDGGS
jgi:pyroglutamyl-peptidase